MRKRIMFMLMVVVDMEAEHAAYLEAMESGIVAEPVATSYSYDRERGRRYADIYYSTGNDDCFFQAPASQGNCTNWVSQCVWAAYGGWSDGDSVSTMKKNIADRKRMQPSIFYNGLPVYAMCERVNRYI